MSLLQLPEQPSVSWARQLPTGGEGGSEATQIDASGLSVRNRTMHEELLPVGGSPSIMITMRCKSTLVANNPAFEGCGVRVRGYQYSSSGDAHSEVYEYDPASKGSSAWHSVQNADWQDVVFVVPVDRAEGIDYFTVELLVRAAGGQITITNVECRYFYGAQYPLNRSGNALWFETQGAEIVSELTTGERTLRFIRYLRTNNEVRIRKGQFITATGKGGAGGFAIGKQYATDEGYSSISGAAGIMYKIRRSGTGQYDYLTIDSFRREPGDEWRRYVEGSIQFRAEHDYDQGELMVFVEGYPPTGWETFTGGAFMIDNFEGLILASDYIAPTQ